MTADRQTWWPRCAVLGCLAAPMISDDVLRLSDNVGADGGCRTDITVR